MFCTNPDGVKGDRAKEWGLVDEVVKTQQFAEAVKQRALQLAEKSDRPEHSRGVPLMPLKRKIDDSGRHYEYVDVRVNHEARIATFSTVKAPGNGYGKLSGGSACRGLQLVAAANGA